MNPRTAHAGPGIGHSDTPRNACATSRPAEVVGRVVAG